MTEAHALYYPERDFQGHRPGRTVWQAWEDKEVEIKWLDPTIHEGRYYLLLEADPEFLRLRPLAGGREMNVRLADIDYGRLRG